MDEMISEIVNSNKNKFIYVNHDDVPSIIEKIFNISDNNAINIPIYIDIEDLPEIETSVKLDKHLVVSFYSNYYEFLISIAIIDYLIKIFPSHLLNKRLISMLRNYSLRSNHKFNTINEFRNALILGKEMYKEAYIKYVTEGKLISLNEMPISVIVSGFLMFDIKRLLNIDKCFQIFMDTTNGMTVFGQRALNRYIGFADRSYLSVNIFTAYDSWKSYYDFNGNHIERVLDYEEIDMVKLSKNIKL